MPARRTDAPDERGAGRRGGAGGVVGGASNGDRSENGDYLLWQEAPARDRPPHALSLTKRLDIAEVVDPAAQPNSRPGGLFSAPRCCIPTRWARTTPSPSSAWMSRAAGRQDSLISPVARADQGARRRHGSAAHAGRGRGAGYPGATRNSGGRGAGEQRRQQAPKRRRPKKTLEKRSLKV